MRLFLVISIITIFLFENCKSNSDEGRNCTLSVDVLYKRDQEKFRTPNKVNGYITSLKDKGTSNTSAGGEYIFYNSGKLKEYRFFVSKENYSYEEFYGNKGMLKSQGNPILLINIGEITSDSLKFEIYTSSLLKWNISLELQINSSHWIVLKPNSYSPFSNVIQFVHPFDAKGLSSVNLYTKMSYKNCRGVRFEVEDSSFFERKL